MRSRSITLLLTDAPHGKYVECDGGPCPELPVRVPGSQPTSYGSAFRAAGSSQGMHQKGNHV